MTFGLGKKEDATLPSKEGVDLPNDVEIVENPGTSPVVDAAQEKILIRKLDLRIIPMICWIYLMNFMDRGKINSESLSKRMLMKE